MMTDLVAKMQRDALKYAQLMDDALRNAIQEADLPALVSRYYPDSGARPGRKGVVLAVWRGEEHESFSLFQGEGGVWLYHDHRTRETGNAFGFLTDICGLAKAEAAKALKVGRGEGGHSVATATLPRPERRTKRAKVEVGDAVYDALLRAVSDRRIVGFEHPLSRAKLSRQAALACVETALKTPHAEDTQRILAAAHQALKDLSRRRRARRREGKPVAYYDYLDGQGTLLYQVVRLEPKAFSQRRPYGSVWAWGLVAGRYVRSTSGNFYLEDAASLPAAERIDLGACPLVLYRLSRVAQAVAQGRPVYLVEGEEDVHALEALGLVATCNAGGAGKWSADYSETLRGSAVTILPDFDAAGENHARKVSEALTGVVNQVRVVRLPGLPPAGDVRDWLQTHAAGELIAKLAQEPEQ